MSEADNGDVGNKRAVVCAAQAFLCMVAGMLLSEIGTLGYGWLIYPAMVAEIAALVFCIRLRWIAAPPAFRAIGLVVGLLAALGLWTLIDRWRWQ